MKRIALLAAGFAYMVLLIEAVRAAVAWWRDELPQAGWTDLALIAMLPALIWIWWRYLSPFGRDCRACASTPDGAEHDSRRVTPSPRYPG